MTEKIHIVNFENNFRTLPNRTAEDPRLSWDAKGLLWYLLSRPSNWHTNRRQLAKIYKGNTNKNGKYAIDRIFTELIEAGYVKYTKQDPETKKFIHRYDIFPIPFQEFQKIFTEPDFPTMEKNPQWENPAMEKSGPLINNEYITNNDNPPLSPQRGDGARARASERPPPKKKKKSALKKKSYGKDGFVKLTDEEYDELIKEHGKISVDQLIEEMNNRIGSRGTKYKSHYHTIKEWYSWRMKKNGNDSAESVAHKRHISEKNKKAAREIIEKINLSKDQVCIDDNCVFVKIGVGMKPIAFSDDDFIKKFKNALGN